MWERKLRLNKSQCLNRELFLMLKLEDLSELIEKHREAAAAQVKEFALGGELFPFNTRPAIMGVINLSTDSWYRESVCLTGGGAVRRAKVLQAQGASIVDLGAESTLAHAPRADEAGHNSHILPVVSALRAPCTPMSAEPYLPPDPPAP